MSVLLPVRNAARTLPAALESIRTQSFPLWELVVIDDGSTDATPELLATVARAEPRLRAVTLPHAGLPAALNAGLERTRAPIVARMDADDVCHPDRLAEQLRFLEAHPDIGVVGCQVEFGGDRTTQAGYAAHVDWLNTLLDPDAIQLARFIDAPLAHPSVAFRRRLVDLHGGYRDGPFPEDYELWLRWLEAGVRMAKVPRPLLRWNDPPDRLSRTSDRYHPAAFYRLKSGFLARWLATRIAPGRPILVWGAGRLTRRRVDLLLHEGVRVSAYLDIDPRKQGRHRDGRTVLAPETLTGPEHGFVLGYVASRGTRELQRAQLEPRGFVEGRDFLFAA